MKRLNVGSGKDYKNPKDGWINLEKNKRFKADIYMDIMGYTTDENSLDEILAKDVIDHVPYTHCQKLVGRFYKWLKNNGRLHVHLPNFKNLARFAFSHDEATRHEAMCWLYGSDGRRAFYETNIIRWSYTPKTARELLEGAGFIVLTLIEDCAGFGMTIIATKRTQTMEEKAI